MFKHPFFHYRIFGIKVLEYLAVLLLYLISSVLYHMILNITRYDELISFSEMVTLNDYIDDGGLMYLIEILLTIPIWWLIFRGLAHWKLEYRLMLHIIGLPLFVLSMREVYYTVCDFFGWGHLGGTAAYWDIYIPGMFYLVQFGIFHSYHYYHENQRSLKKQAALNEAALKSELAALKAQLNPHFLYNVFNTISASVPPEMEQTREMIAELSDLFRYQLKASKTEEVTLKEELDFVEKYLRLEKARFEDRLVVKIDVPAELLEKNVPPMLLQPLVENSVKHGISSLIEGGEIAIKATKEGDKVHFQVSDTGVGVENTESLFGKGIGLTNTKLRLEKMYGTMMHISSNFPQGLRIDFSF